MPNYSGKHTKDQQTDTLLTILTQPAAFQKLRLGLSLLCEGYMNVHCTISLCVFGIFTIKKFFKVSYDGANLINIQNFLTPRKSQRKIMKIKKLWISSIHSYMKRLNEALSWTQAKIEALPDKPKSLQLSNGHLNGFIIPITLCRKPKRW